MKKNIVPLWVVPLVVTRTAAHTQRWNGVTAQPLYRCADRPLGITFMAGYTVSSFFSLIVRTLSSSVSYICGMMRVRTKEKKEPDSLQFLLKRRSYFFSFGAPLKKLNRESGTATISLPFFFFFLIIWTGVSSFIFLFLLRASPNNREKKKERKQWILKHWAAYFFFIFVFLPVAAHA